MVKIRVILLSLRSPTTDTIKNILETLPLFCYHNPMCASFHKPALPAIMLFSFLIFSCTSLPEKQKEDFQNEDWRQEPEVISSRPVEWKDILLAGQGNKKTSGTVSYQAFLKDLETFRYLMQSAYIGYEKAEAQGLNLDTCIKNLKNLFKGQTEIQTKKIYDALYAELSPYITDNHFFIYYYIYKTQLCSHSNIYFSDVYVNKNGEIFTKAFESSQGIAEGSTYTGKRENLFYYPVKGKDIYRIGAAGVHALFSLETEFEGQKVNLPLKSDTAIQEKNNLLTGKRSTEKSAYISLSSFVLPQENDTRRKAADIMIDRLWDYIEENHEKENLIIDLRSNGGGVMALAMDFADSLLCGSDYFMEKTPVLTLDRYQTERLISPAILQAEERWTEDLGSYAEGYKEYINETIKVFKEKPRRERHLEDFFNKAYENGQPVKDRYQNKIYVLIDRNTGSSSELFYSYLVSVADDPEKIKLVGENSSGRIENGAVWEYLLPETNIVLGLSSQTFTPTLSRVKAWQGEGTGLYPDYWCRGEDLLETLVTLTGDEELREALEGLYEGLLL